MADTDLLFSIIAQDEYSAKLQEARAQVDALTETEKQAIAITAQHQAVEAQMANAFDLSSEAKQRALAQLTQLDQQYQAGQISLTQYSAGVDQIKNTLDNVVTSEGNAADSTANLTKAQDSAAASSVNWAQALTGIQSGIEIAQETIGAFKKVWDFAKEGAAINRIGEQFKAVASEAGVNADGLVEAMDRAAKGTIDDEELMQTATRALTQGVITNANDLTKFVEIARASSVRFGGDATQALQSILYATEVGAQRSLKATIGVVDFTKSYEDLAKQLGKRKQDLTDEEQLQARVNAVLEKGGDLVKKVGTSLDDTATSMQRIEVRFADFGDVVKGNVATALDGILFGQEKVNNLMVAHEQQVRETAKSYQEYSAEVIRSGELTGQLSAVSREQYDAQGNLIGQYVRLNDQLYRIDGSFKVISQAEFDATHGAYGLSGALDESTRAAQRTADEQQRLADQLRAAQNAASDYSDAADRATQRTKELAAADASARESLVSSDLLAVQYTQTEQKRADIVQKLADLEDKIAANGPARSAQVANQKMTEEQRALTLQKLAVAQEDISQIQRKAGETDAEYALRVETAKQKVDALSASLGTHTVALGGATKAELEQKKSLEGQLAAFDQAAEKQRAADVFNAVAEAIKSGKLSAEEGSQRLGALNSITHIYSDTALKTAQSQLTLIAAMTDPKSDAWRSQLIIDQGAIDGVIEKTGEATQAISTLNKKKAEEVEIPLTKAGTGAAAQAALDYTNKSEKEAGAAKAAIEKVSQADEAASREMKGRVDNIAGGYYSVGNAIDDTKKRQAEMTTDAIAGAQARSTAQEKESRETKGRVDEVIGEYQKVPKEIKTTLTLEVKPAGEAITAAAGDSIAERAAQARAQGTLADTSKSATTATDQIKTASSEAIDSIHKMVAPATSDINSVADRAKTKLSDVSASVVQAFQTMGIVAGGEVNTIQNAVDKLPTYKEFVYHIKVTGDEIPDVAGGSLSLGGAHAAGIDMIIPPNYNDNYPLGTGKSGERFIVQTPEQQAAAQGYGAQVNHNETINLYDTLITRQVAEQRRIDALKSITGAM